MRRCTKKRDSHSAVPFFCIVKLFELLHSQEFARGGGHTAFLSSAHSLPADNAIERLARRSSLTVHQKCGQEVRPAAFFASLSCSDSCILRSSRAKAGTRNDLSYAALFMRPSFRRAPPKFSRGSFPRAAPAKGQPAWRLSPHSPQDRYPASDRSRPALRSAPR